MAGLCGVFVQSESVDVDALNRRLSPRSRHRGPDGSNQWSGSAAAMTHQ